VLAQAKQWADESKKVITHPGNNRYGWGGGYNGNSTGMAGDEGSMTTLSKTLDTLLNKEAERCVCAPLCLRGYPACMLARVRLQDRGSGSG
jgi:hypothetical protein